MKLISIIFASGLCAATAGTASANEVAVRYAALDLSTERGQAELAHRVDAAAREACHRTPRPGSLLTSPQSEACYDRASAEAREQVAAAIQKRGGTSLALRTRAD